MDSLMYKLTQVKGGASECCLSAGEGIRKSHKIWALQNPFFMEKWTFENSVGWFSPPCPNRVKTRFKSTLQVPTLIIKWNDQANICLIHFYKRHGLMPKLLLIDCWWRTFSKSFNKCWQNIQINFSFFQTDLLFLV